MPHILACPGLSYLRNRGQPLGQSLFTLQRGVMSCVLGQTQGCPFSQAGMVYQKVNFAA